MLNNFCFLLDVAAMLTWLWWLFSIDLTCGDALMVVVVQLERGNLNGTMAMAMPTMNTVTTIIIRSNWNGTTLVQTLASILWWFAMVMFTIVVAGGGGPCLLSQIIKRRRYRRETMFRNQLIRPIGSSMAMGTRSMVARAGGGSMEVFSKIRGTLQNKR